MYSILPASVSPSVVFGTKAPTTTLGDTLDPFHSVLLPSGPIKRPRQHSVAIRQLRAYPLRLQKRKGVYGGGGGEGGGLQMHSLLAYLVVSCIFCLLHT